MIWRRRLTRGRTDEFPLLGVEAFRGRLEQLLRAEEAAARAAQEQHRQAQQVPFTQPEAADLECEQEAAALATLAALINDAPPTAGDRLLALGPYLLPLLDSLDYGRALLPDSAPFSAALQLSRAFAAVPFSGLGAFWLLSVWVRDPALNRLVRFNIQQAILLDVALVLPGLAGLLLVSPSDTGQGLAKGCG